MAKLWTHAIRPLVALLILAMLAGSVAPVYAADKKPVPSAVLEGGDGAPLELALVAAEGQWLMLYLAPGTPATVRLLDALRQWQLPALDHVIVMVGGGSAEARAFVQADHALPGVRFFLDPERDAWRALQLTGVPTVIGVRNNLLDWRLAGVLNDPETLRALLANWLTTP